MLRQRAIDSAWGSQGLPGQLLPLLSDEGRVTPALGGRLRAQGLCLSLGVHLAALACLLQTTAVPPGVERSAEAQFVELVSEKPPQEMQEETRQSPAKAELQPLSQPIPPLQPARPPQLTSPPRHQRLPSPQPQHMATMAEPSGPVVASNDATVSAPPPPAAPMATPSSVAAGERLQLYQQVVWAQIMQHKPSGIRFQGTVELSFRLSADGQLVASEVSGPSGMGVLDRAALEALRAAAPFPPPPENATAEQLTFKIPFHFR